MWASAVPPKKLVESADHNKLIDWVALHQKKYSEMPPGDSVMTDSDPVS